MSSSDWLSVGYVSRAHGLKGSVIVKTFDPASTALGEVERLQLTPKAGAPRELEIDGLRDGPGGDLLLELVGVSSREAAEALVGSTISVHRDDLDPPAEGEFFLGDLIGLSASTPEGRALGTIADVWSSGPVPNLVIRDAAGNEELVPFAEEFVVKVDLPARKIVVIPPVYEEVR